MIGEAKADASKAAAWDEGAYQKARMDEKVQLLSALLPEFVVKNRGVYAIMSKGIHELTEAECLEYFPAVRVAIELILDEKLGKLERDKKIASTTASLGSILSKLK